MKFSDVFELGIRDIKKHKMRFCLNVISIAIILLLIFVLISFIFSIDATVKEDMKKHLTANGNAITVSLSGVHNEKGIYGVTWDESQRMKSFMTNYDPNVGIRENVWHNRTEVNIGLHTAEMDVCYFGEKSIYCDGEIPRLIEGKEWEECTEKDNCIWISQQMNDYITYLNLDIKIGDEVKFTVAGQSDVVFELAGIVEGGSAYVTKKCAIESGVVSVSYINYDLTLKDGKNPVKSLKQLQKSLDGIDKGFAKDEGQIDRISCDEFVQLYGLRYTVMPYRIILALVILFFTILILGVLKNNAAINVFDNMKSYSLLRCIGLENKKLAAISIVETLLCICISAVLGGVLTFAFRGLISKFVYQAIGEELYDLHTFAYDSAWWVMICYFAVLSLLAIGYFSMTLIKYLKRKNLLGTLKRE